MQQKVPTVEIRPLVLDATDFRVQFAREKDRFTHQLQLPNGHRFLQSITDQNDSNWPPDPPLQQVVLEDIAANGTLAALGVGMCGHGHWSLAAEPVKLPCNGIRFDWACRIDRGAERLLSSYRVASDVTIETLPLATPDLRSKQLRLHCAGGLAIRIDVELGRLEWDANERAIRILPEKDIESPGTYRWCYRIVAE